MAETLAAVTHTHTHNAFTERLNENKIENSIRISSVYFCMNNKKSYV